MEKIKETIRAFGKSIGFDAIGFTSREKMLTQDKRYEEYLALGYSSGFEEKDHAKRIDGALALENCQSVISVLVAYPHQEMPLRQAARGRFCAASWGIDYHRYLGERLEMLGQYCQRLLGCHYKVMVDTGSLSDRGAGVCAGLGWIGRNSNLIHPEWGSFVYLGELLLDVALPDDAPVNDGCQECQRCVKACPLGAIDGEKRMVNTQKCLAYQTLNKGALTDAVMAAIGQRGVIYGCDICQSVCPYNQKSLVYPEALWGKTEERNPDLLALLMMTNKTFKAAYGHLSGAWRGAAPLKRNAVLILGHRHAPEHRVFLEQLLQKNSNDTMKTAKNDNVSRETLSKNNSSMRTALLWALKQYEK